jgi:hypothetical protein
LVGFTGRAGTDGNLSGYIKATKLQSISEPKAMGSVVVLDTSVTIKAGTLIGHAGKYQNYNEALPLPLAHLEVFSCEDVQAFITTSRSKASALLVEQQTLLPLAAGTKVITHRADITSANPPQYSYPGVLTGYGMTIPVSVLEALAEKKITQTVTLQGVTTKTLWRYLVNVLGDASDNLMSGWVGEQDVLTDRAP